MESISLWTWGVAPSEGKIAANLRNPSFVLDKKFQEGDSAATEIDRSRSDAVVGKLSWHKTKSAMKI